MILNPYSHYAKFIPILPYIAETKPGQELEFDSDQKTKRVKSVNLKKSTET